MDQAEIISQFEVEGRVHDVKSHGNGHIHDTYHVKTSEEDAPNYLLQKINHRIFKDVKAMMRNIDQVTTFIRQHFPDKTSLTLIRTTDGQAYLQNQEQYWRIFLFLEGLISYDQVEDENLVYEGSRLLGDFLNDLSGLDPQVLDETIPDFHNLMMRLDQFEGVLANARSERVSQTSDLVKVVRSLGPQLSELEVMRKAGYLTNRITHNDTKLNNVLYDQSGKAQCVIDLDTVMPGLVHYDFGDGIRTACTTAAEDEADLQLVGFDQDKLRAYCAGYLESTRDMMTDQELDTLNLATPLMSFIMGVRFFTDFLQGDLYYKTHYPDQNLNRARAQLHLAQEAWYQRNDFQQLLRRA